MWIDIFHCGYDDVPTWARCDRIQYAASHAVVKTANGDVKAEKGDYIVRHKSGEFEVYKGRVK